MFIFAMTDAPVFLLFQCRRVYCLQLRRVSFLQTRKPWAVANCTARMQCLAYMNSPGWLETQPIKRFLDALDLYIPLGPVRKIVKIVRIHTKYTVQSNARSFGSIKTSPHFVTTYSSRDLRCDRRLGASAGLVRCITQRR